MRRIVMEHKNDAAKMLDLMDRPAFCAHNGLITQVNTAAAGLGFSAGDALENLIRTGADEYEAFNGGCLYLTLDLDGERLGASVTRMEEFDVFCLEELADGRELQAMALAARELRGPLSTIMLTAQRLFPVTALEDSPEVRRNAAQLNRGLYQMLRVVGNMSDAGHYATSTSRQETVNICAEVEEIFRKAAQLVSHTGITLEYQGPAAPIYCLADQENLERAILNMVSNSVKFTPAGGVIRGSLTRNGSRLYLSVQDNGCGIAPNLMGSVFTRFQRQCGLEDRRFGIGLGLVLVRSAATAHGGAVLIDSPEGGGTRVTMTLAIRHNEGIVRSRLMKVDYAGELDHSLFELSEFLPDFLYEGEF